jgi:hypothetical protein
VDLLLSQLSQISSVVEVIIGQNYSQQEIKEGWTDIYHSSELPKNVHLVETVRENLEHPSRSHTNTLNQILRNWEFRGSNVIIFDSDCIPLKETWIEEVSQLMGKNDAILALSQDFRFASHICFFVFKKNILHLVQINFENYQTNLDGQEWEYRLDSGSDLGLILLRNGAKIYFLKPTRGFKGKLGYMYLNDSILHVTGQSFYGRKNHKRNRNATAEYLSYEFPRIFITHLITNKESQNKSLIFILLHLVLKGKISVFRIVSLLIFKTKNFLHLQ